MIMRGGVKGKCGGMRSEARYEGWGEGEVCLDEGGRGGVRGREGGGVRGKSAFDK